MKAGDSAWNRVQNQSFPCHPMGNSMWFQPCVIRLLESCRKEISFLAVAILIDGGLLATLVGMPSSIAASNEQPIEYALAVHGGAGWEPANMTAEDREVHRAALERALDVGTRILRSGGTALDAVEQAIRMLEDEPLYNAGRGAVFNARGQHELDAAIMDGKHRTAGAVAAVTTVRNPISLARLVMTETKHVLLIGSGAEQFADEMRLRPQIERVANEYFSTEVRRREWRVAVDREKREQADRERIERERPSKLWDQQSQDTRPEAFRHPFVRDQSRDPSAYCTVGCVARDKKGNLAAGTSTGGLTNKRWGRVGAVPVPGAGTYADNRTCAVSGTGTGELFLLNCTAFQIHSQMQLAQRTLSEAARVMIDETMPKDSGGVIAIDGSGRVVMRCNTPGMARAATDSSGKVVFEIER
jgi:beta-aspartyl-peptidase (threonine type)